MSKEKDDKSPLRVGVSLKKLLERGPDKGGEWKKKEASLKKRLKDDPGKEDKSIRSKKQRQGGFRELLERMYPSSKKKKREDKGFPKTIPPTTVTGVN